MPGTAGRIGTILNTHETNTQTPENVVPPSQRDHDAERSDTTPVGNSGVAVVGRWYRMDDSTRVLTFIYVLLMLAWLFILLIRCWDILFEPERRTE